MEKTCVNDKFKFIIPTGRSDWDGAEWLLDQDRLSNDKDYKELMIGESMVIAMCDFVEDPQPATSIDDDDDDDDDEEEEENGFKMKIGKLFLSDALIRYADELLAEVPDFKFPDDYDLDMRRMAAVASVRCDGANTLENIQTYISAPGIGPRRADMDKHSGYAW